MKNKRLFILVVLIVFVTISIFIIYKSAYKEVLNYVVLGDSLAAGRNPYGVDDYGYADYINDYLKSKNKLESYVNYAVSGYLTSDIIDDINYNKIVEVDGDSIGLKKALRESHLVIISIGANDLISGSSTSSVPLILTDKEKAIEQINNTMNNVKELLELVKKYAKGDIIVIGYYNPLPHLIKYKSNIDEVISYADQEYRNLCDSMGIHFVKISDVIAGNSDYLPNPLDIHPNKQGYEAISKEIINTIENKVFK